jgi:hypothetical protein
MSTMAKRARQRASVLQSTHKIIVRFLVGTGRHSHYSYLSAAIGSTRIARRAGM